MEDENNTGDQSEENEGVTYENLLAAISEGIEEATPEIKADPEEESEEESEDEDAGDDKDGDEDDAGSDDLGDDEGSADSEDGDDGVDDKDDDDDSDGKPKADDDKDSDDAEVDPINDPIPESTNKKTAGRIQSLIGIAKDTTAQAEQGQEILAAIEATGADPDQYAATLSFIQLYNSDKVEDRQQALTAAQGVVRELSIKLGVNVGSVIKLGDHKDLEEEVAAGTLGEERAIEIAAQREKATMDDASEAARKKKDDDASAADALVATGRDQLNNLEATLNAADPSYVTLRPKFLELLRPILPNTPANKWGEVAQGVYKQLKDIAGSAEAPAPRVKPKNTPLRPKGDSGGSNGKKSEVSSAEEAMDAALENM